MNKIITTLCLLICLAGGVKSQPYCLDFDGINDEVNLGDNLDFEYTEAFTVEAWVKTGSNVFLQQIFSKLGAAFRGWGFQVHEGRLNAYLISTFNENELYVEGINTINDDNWHHVAMVYNGLGEIDLYIDGVEEITEVFGEVTETILNEGNACIGCYNTGLAAGEFWNGNIDNLKIWKSERSQEEIITSMNQCSAELEPGLLALYTFENGPGSLLLTDQSGNDFNGTLINMDPLTDWVSGQFISSVDSKVACNSFTWIDDITYTTSNNTATFTLMNDAGCDSIVYLDLTIYSINTIVNVTNENLSSLEFGATYQWLDCGNNYDPIVGETGQIFSASASGTYAVEITENGCVDTSECVNLTLVSIDDQLLNEEVSIFPNPSSGLVNIDFGIVHEVTVNVFNTTGQGLYRQENILTKTHQIDLSNEASGIYFIELISNEKSKYYKVLKD